MKKIAFFICLLLATFSFSQIDLGVYLSKIGTEFPNDTNKVKYLNFISTRYTQLGKFDSSIYFGERALDLSRELNFKRGSSLAMESIASAYYNQGRFAQALKNHFEALEIAESLKDKQLTAVTLGNIAMVYEETGEYMKAFRTYLLVKNIAQQLKNEVLVANQYANIAVVKRKQGFPQQAIEYNLKALAIHQKRNDKRKVAAIYSNLGAVYGQMNENEKALDYGFKALAIDEEQNDPTGVAIDLGNIGGYYLSLKKYKDAELYFNKALELSRAIGDNYGIMNITRGLAEIKTVNGDHKTALVYYKEYMALDSTFKADQEKALAEIELNYEFKKIELEKKAEQDKKDAVTKATQKKQGQVIFVVCCGLLLVLICAVLIFRSLRITRKQKTLIELKNIETEEQKHTIEEKSKEITDSINYAQRIQRGILPSSADLQKAVGEHFVLFKPKDIVSGDFYWCAETGSVNLIAAADSTGHGVPGAFMSMLGKTLLNQAVKDPSVQMPSQVLNYVNAELPNNLRSHGKETSIKDGMDIVLCAIDRKKNVLHFAGANNPLWIVRNTALIELEATKQAITATNEYEKKPFNDKFVELQKGDCVYLFTDGYADQFGGPKGKKFKYKQLADILKEICVKPVDEQRHILEQRFNAWKGDLEQVDDVCIIGIKI
jgi:serine phosphatase RsbU (regulator of sigma subunit)